MRKVYLGFTALLFSVLISSCGGDKGEKVVDNKSDKKREEW